MCNPAIQSHSAIQRDQLRTGIYTNLVSRIRLLQLVKDWLHLPNTTNAEPYVKQLLARGVFSYNNGEKKLQITRENSSGVCTADNVFHTIQFRGFIADRISANILHFINHNYFRFAHNFLLWVFTSLAFGQEVGALGQKRISVSSGIETRNRFILHCQNKGVVCRYLMEVCMAEMLKIKQAAQKRRAKYLAEFKRLGWTITKFATRHGMTRARMSQLILKAKEENVSF